MSLKQYAEKRSFNQTPEPAPHNVKKPAAQSAPMFCVQRHHASHLHYDFRLEVDGTLKSWAVPKGPTLDPGQKRLAMMVEDHPIEYGGFEGVIPAGNYGAGSVMLWDRGTFQILGAATAEEQLARGDFKFHLEGEKLAGDFALVHIKGRTRSSKGNEWLLIKKRDPFASPGWNPEDHGRSVLTGRSQEEIAKELDPVKKASSAGKNGGARKKPDAKTASVSAKKTAAANNGAVKKKSSAGEGQADLAADPAKIAGAKRAPMPAIVSPMLAELGKGDPPPGKEWLYEIKWDGVRALCFIDAESDTRSGHEVLRIASRNGNDITLQYPELSVLPHHLRARQAVVDGEIAALDKQGRPSFEQLQGRMHLMDAAAVARLSRNAPVTLFVFDVLYLDGYDLRGAALADRKKLLAEVLTPEAPILFSAHFEGEGTDVLEAARAHGLEGVVGKRASSKYESRRSGDWVKWKVTDASDFLICGYTAGDRHGLGALILGERREGKLEWAGNVGTGFDRKLVELLFETMKPLETSQSPFPARLNMPGERITWVKPELVCEVRFSNRTREGRLRAPVFLRLRDDLDAPSAHTDLLDASKKEAALTIDGHALKFTHLDKVFYPDDGYRKRDLLNYYDAVAPFILPHLKDRPLSLKRYPNGIAQDFFFQKNTPESFPKWLKTQEADDICWVIGNDRATLLYLVNLGCIDHNPWMSRIEAPSRGGSLDHPDYLLIDLDPQECGYEKIVEAALWVRAKLDRAGLESYPKTTGGDGMHVFVPLEPIYTYEQVRSFAQVIATIGAGERPDLFTTPRTPSKRDKGKVYLDWPQIAQGKTIAAPYVLRAYPGAPVAAPLDWSEVTPRLRPEQFHMRNALARFERVGDLFEGVLTRPQRLEKALDKLR
jgi:bifunctional non-homologous end joining protein LigD